MEENPAKGIVKQIDELNIQLKNLPKHRGPKTKQ